MARKQKAKKGTETGAEHSEREEAEDTVPAGEVQDLYAVLGVEKTASQAEIKKAYHRIALQLHPDKNRGDEGAKEKFQTLQHVFSILKDEEKRRIYDQTGSAEDADLAGDSFQNLYEYFRSTCTKVTEEEICRFEAEYRGSEEEQRDLKELYTRFKGDMQRVFEYMMFSEPKVDSHRFRDSLQAAIKAGEVKSYKVFKEWAGEVAKKPAPANPLKPRKQSKGGKGSEQSNSDLRAIISHRQSDRVLSLIGSLTAKYGGEVDGAQVKGGRGKKRVAAEPEISEEEFAKIQKKILRKKKSTS